MAKNSCDFDFFFDPQTGERVLQNKYILMGGNSDISQPSPALIDLWTELAGTTFIVQQASTLVPSAQALNLLEPGILRQDGGIISIQGALPPDWLSLTENYVFLGNSDNVAVPSPTILLQNLPPFLSIDITSNFGFTNLYTGGINLDPANPIAPTTTMRVNTCNLPNLSTGKIWMGVVQAIPPNLTLSLTPPYVTWTGYPSYETLNWDILGLGFSSHAVPVEVGLDPGTIFMGDVNNPGQIIQVGLAQGKIFIGDTSGRLSPNGLPEGNMFIGNNFDQVTYTNLPQGNVFIGNDADQIVFTGLNGNQMFAGNSLGQIVKLNLVGGQIPFCNYDESGIISAGLNAYELFTGNPDNSGQIQAVTILDISNMANLSNARMWLGNAENRPTTTGLGAYQLFSGDPGDTGNIIAIDQIDRINLPNLSTGKVWLGSVDNSPVETGLSLATIFTGNSSDQIIPLTIGINQLIFCDSTGNLVSQGLPGGFMFIGKSDDSGEIVQTTLAQGSIFVGNDTDEIVPLQFTPGTMMICNEAGNLIASGLYPGYTWMGDDSGQIQVTGLFAGTIFIGNSDNSGEMVPTNALSGQILSGNPDNSGGFLIIDPPFADNNATYVLRLADDGLPNAQVLSSLTNGIANVIDGYIGTFSLTGGTGITVTNGNSVAGNPVVTLSDTTVVAGYYEFASVTVNAQGQLTEAVDNSDVITEIQDNISTINGEITTINGRLDVAEGNISTNTADILTLDTTVGGLVTDVGIIDATLYDPVLGIATIVVPGLVVGLAALGVTVAAIDLTVNAPAVGLVDRMNFLTSSLIDGTIAAKFIVQTANVVVPNAQALDVLGGGILQADSSGVISIASGVGSVTSVGIASSYLLVSGTPITSSGTIEIDFPASGATAGRYINPTIEVTDRGLVTFIENGTGEGEWDVVSGDTPLEAGRGYFADSSSGIITFTLPTSAIVGDTFKVRGMGLGGWQVAQNSGQLIVVAAQATTPGTGGSLQSNFWSAGIDIICVVDNVAFIGNVVSDIVNVI